MINLMNADCMEVLDSIPTDTVDLVIIDPPYGVTKCDWDVIIPLSELFTKLNRVLKDNGALLVFGVEPFSSYVRLEHKKYYRYDIVYEKSRATGFLNANRQPLRAHEIISVFYKKQPTYNPQKVSGSKKCTTRVGVRSKVYTEADRKVVYCSTERYPRSIIRFNSEQQTTVFHPTQKPVELLEYLVKTYSNEGDTVLDCVMGSGSTGVAATNLGRSFIGIENNTKFFETALRRITGRE